MNTLSGKTALITGASSGIGFEMAKIFAQANVNLVLVARRKKNLEDLKKAINEKSKVKIDIISMDMSLPNSPKDLHKKTKKLGSKIDILINNAGYGIYGKFLDSTIEENDSMIMLLVNNLVKTTHLYAKDMAADKFGFVLNVSSVGAFQPTPYYSTYAAAKSFVLNFSIALNHELAGTGVSVSALCPGFTATEFQQVANQKKISKLMEFSMMSAEEVAKTGIQEMLRRKPVIVPGAINQFNTSIVKMLPLNTSSSIAASAIGKPE